MGTKRICEIAHDEQLRHKHARLLREFGYAVVSILGNETAKVLLRSIQHYDLFIVSHATPGQAREMIDWLKREYPNTSILVLNPFNEEVVGADYNVQENDPQNWLSLVAAISDRASSPDGVARTS